MTNQVDNITFNTEIYPNIYISSKNLNNSRGLFLINPTTEINLIKESHLANNITIDRTQRFILTLGSINTTGTVYITIAKKSIKFHTFKCNIQPQVTGILGLSFLNTNPNEFHL